MRSEACARSLAWIAGSRVATQLRPSAMRSRTAVKPLTSASVACPVCPQTSGESLLALMAVPKESSERSAPRYQTRVRIAKSSAGCSCDASMASVIER